MSIDPSALRKQAAMMRNAFVHGNGGAHVFDPVPDMLDSAADEIQQWREKDAHAHQIAEALGAMKDSDGVQ